MVYWYARWDGTQWTKSLIPNTITGSLPPAATTQNPSFAPGIALDPEIPGLIYASIGNAIGTQCTLYRLVSLDGGSTWSQTVISPPAVVGERYSGQDYHPYVPRNRDRRAGVLWLRGRFNASFWDPIVSTQSPGGSYHSEVMSAPV